MAGQSLRQPFDLTMQPPSPPPIPPAAPPDFTDLLQVLTHTHRSLQQQAARSVDVALVVRNWLFGWYIVQFEQGNAEHAVLYGKKLMQRLAEGLSSRGISGASPTSLRQCRSFFLAYEKMQQTASVESLPEVLKQHFSLGWSHYVQLLTLENEAERRFYEIEAKANAWGVRELKRQIESSLYQRLALSRDKDQIRALGQKGQVVSRPQDILKNPYVLEFLDLPQHPAFSEQELETAIINRLESFLLELGKGFLFEARQKRFTFDDDHFYVDLVFYNRLLKCYVLIDLKRDKLTHQDLGQMQMYVNYFDRFVKTAEEAPTIGIVLCHRKNDALVELTLPPDANIYAAKYQLYLPSKEELQAQVQASLLDQAERR
jgi:predicted nuclease of restriction endonuclease-like (RecB) superfamily